jgi:hypothetical protein
MTWEQVGQRYKELSARELTTENVQGWLHEWSELEKEVGEHYAALSRAKNEDTRDKAAEEAYLTFVREVFPQMQTAEQELKTKFLGQNYEPGAEHTEFVKRFRNETELFREENVALLAEK